MASTITSNNTALTSTSNTQPTKPIDPIFKKPARRQVNPETQEKTQKVYEGTYNIWYNKWTGQKHKGRFEIGERAPTRVNIEKDTGYTLADKRKLQNPTFKTYFCLQFARGCCYMGHKCEYMHRIPRLDDLEETIKDCFGRDRHRDERDDMNGVGCFNRENRTIYLGNLHPYDVAEGERVIRRHFSPFGEIERINVIHGKSIAFVRYKKRANAEFAKEAMEHQSLDAGEILNVRWANDDPNPRAQLEAKRKLEETFAQHYVAKKAKERVQDPTSSSKVDPELKKLVEKHPTYHQYYSYYQVQSLPSSSSSIPTTTTNTTTTSSLSLPPPSSTSSMPLLQTIPNTATHETLHTEPTPSSLPSDFVSSLQSNVESSSPVVSSMPSTSKSQPPSSLVSGYESDEDEET